MTLRFKDTPFYDDTGNEEYWTGTWNYEQIWLEDHYALPVYKLSRLLGKITKLQITSPELKSIRCILYQLYHIISNCL